MKITCNGPCNRELEHSPENFYVQSGRLRIRCKQCHNQQVKAWHKEHPEYYEEYQKDWVKANKAANPEKWRERQFRQDMKKMGKTPEWYNETFAAQNGVCRICGRPETEIHPKTKEIQRLAVDHDHACCPGDRSCGKCVRGLLCAKCNQCLHQVEEVPNWLYFVSDYLTYYKHKGDLFNQK
jgi:hypothetical protein